MGKRLNRVLLTAVSVMVVVGTAACAKEQTSQDQTAQQTTSGVQSGETKATTKPDAGKQETTKAALKTEAPAKTQAAKTQDAQVAADVTRPAAESSAAVEPSTESAQVITEPAQPVIPVQPTTKVIPDNRDNDNDDNDSDNGGQTAGEVVTQAPTVQETTAAQEGTTAVQPTQEQPAAAKKPSDILDFSTWKLQLPEANAAGNSVLEINQEQLKSGYENNKYFYVDSDNQSVVMDCPVGGFKTANTNYARTELREMIGASSSDNWGWNGTHILRCSESVSRVPSNGKTVVSQIHGIYPNGDNGPVLVKVQYNGADSTVEVLLKTATAANSAEKRGYFRGVELNQRFDTEIKCVNGILYVTVASEGRSETYFLNFMESDPEWGGQLGYFKVGNYVQDSDINYEGEGATVKVYSIETFHDDQYVEQVAVSGLVMEQEQVRLNVGEHTKLGVTFQPLDATNKNLQWQVVSGNDKAVVDNQGNVTAVAVGNAVVRAVSAENGSLFAESSITVGNEPPQQAVEIYSQNFGTGTAFDIAAASEWTNGTTDTAKAEVVKEENNYLLKLTDTTVAGSAKMMLDFGRREHATTVQFRVRADAVEVKDPTGAKAQASYLYLVTGGKDGFLTSAEETFRMKNGATYQAGTLSDHKWLLSHGYLAAPLNPAAANFNLGDWKTVTLVITPSDGTAKANTTDVYMDGYKVADKMRNNVENDYLNQIEFYTGTKDCISFSIDDIVVYDGANPPESQSAAPSAVTISNMPSSMLAGTSIQLESAVEPAGAAEGVQYELVAGADKAAVSDSGFLTAVTAGSATLRVKSAVSSAVYKDYPLTIVADGQFVGVNSIQIPETLSVNLNDAYTFVPTILPANATEKKVQYTVVSGSDVLSIDASGKVTTLSAGSAVVRVTSLQDSRIKAECNVTVINNQASGTVLYEDSFDTLNLNKWTVPAANNTVVEATDGALHFVDNNVSGQPKAYLDFEPQTDTFTIEFRVKMLADPAASGSSNASALTFAFGAGGITKASNEAFRFKTAGKVTAGVTGNREFVYSKEAGASGFYNAGQTYELGTWYTIKLVTTPDNGSARANTTDVYINGTKLVTAAANKVSKSSVSQLIFQTATGDLTEFCIDDLKIIAGE